MVLDGRSIVDKAMLTFDPDVLLDTEDQIQPNGVDLRINKLYDVKGRVTIPREGKTQSDLTARELEAKDGYWSLTPGGLYYVDFVEAISVPAKWCATLTTRSSLVRAGVDVVSGLWDTGFTGTLGCTLRVWSPVDLEWGAKLCQVMFWESAFSGHYYTGRYQGTNSQTAMDS